MFNFHAPSKVGKRTANFQFFALTKAGIKRFIFLKLQIPFIALKIVLTKKFNKSMELFSTTYNFHEFQIFWQKTQLQINQQEQHLFRFVEKIVEIVNLGIGNS